MCFSNVRAGLNVYTDGFERIGATDLNTILFAENPAVVIQVSDANKTAAETILDNAGLRYFPIASPSKLTERIITVSHGKDVAMISIDAMRSVWFEPSYMLDSMQTKAECALARRDNLGKQPLEYRFRPNFTGTLQSLGLRSHRRAQTGIRAAIIREKGINGEREMAYSLYLAGFDVKDVHMTDLMEGRETLDDVNMIVF